MKIHPKYKNTNTKIPTKNQIDKYSKYKYRVRPRLWKCAGPPTLLFLLAPKTKTKDENTPKIQKYKYKKSDKNQIDKYSK